MNPGAFLAEIRPGVRSARRSIRREIANRLYGPAVSDGRQLLTISRNDRSVAHIGAMIVSIPSFPARDWMLCQAEFYEKLQRFGHATPLDVALAHQLP